MYLCCVESLSSFRLKLFELWSFKENFNLNLYGQDYRDNNGYKKCHDYISQYMYIYIYI